MAKICNLNTQEAKQEDGMFKICLGYMGRLCHQSKSRVDETAQQVKVLAAKSGDIEWGSSLGLRYILSKILATNLLSTLGREKNVLSSASTRSQVGLSARSILNYPPTPICGDVGWYGGLGLATGR